MCCTRGQILEFEVSIDLYLRFLLILIFEMILQILGFSYVQKYNSWITNKLLYPIHLRARRKGAEPPELWYIVIVDLRLFVHLVINCSILYYEN